MNRRRTCSLFLIIMVQSIILDPVWVLGHLQKKKVSLINNDEVLSPARTHSLEDFFWTGSGDGPLPPSERSINPTIIRTTTVLATVFLDATSTITTDNVHSEEDCFTECPIGPVDGEIDPTKVGGHIGGNEGPEGSLPDPRYWLLTVLRAPAVPLPPSLSRSLARLYQRAFLRQQERHLGIVTPASTRKKHHTIHNNTANNLDKSNTSVQHDSLNENATMMNTEDIKSNHLEVNPTKVTEMNIENNTELAYEFISNYYNDTLPTPSARAKRSANSIAQELNIILLRNYSYDSLKNYSDALDVVKRDIYGDVEQPTVEVFLHNLTRENKTGVNDELKVVYWVSVGGRPVPAKTAARDMRLLADSEVVAELGYPITTKAEPYLKNGDSINGVMHAYNMRDTWLIVGGAILAAIILLSLVSFLACRLVTHRKSSGTSRVLHSNRTSLDDKRIHYPSDTIKGNENLAYMKEEKENKIISVVSPSKRKTDERYVTHGAGYNQSGKYKMDRVSSASSSSSSGVSDVSQMATALRQRQKLFDQQMQNEYATINKKNKTKHRRIRSKRVGIADEAVHTDNMESFNQRQIVLSSPSSHSTSSCDSVIVRRPHVVLSPTSYLSMPSVKSFPRGNAVEPLSRVLEPLSVRHLDMDSDSPVHGEGKKLQRSDDTKTEQKIKSVDDSIQDPNIYHRTKSSGHEGKPKTSSCLVRLGSMDKDPGVIGPLVWDMHRQRIEKDLQGRDCGDGVVGTNISKMRQRFSELVDDAFSLFGSGSSSPTSSNVNTQIQYNDMIKENKLSASTNIPTDVSDNKRRHSAKEGTLNIPHKSEKGSARPHTALPMRPPLPNYNINPTLAWGSNTSTPQVRATSAGTIRRPTIDVTLVNSDDLTSSNDPAAPLIMAMKKELERLPGTSDA